MKEQIKTNLKRIFNQSYELIKDSSFQDIINELIENNPEVYDLDSGLIRKQYEDEDIELLEKSKQNNKLIDLFESAKAQLNTGSQFIEGIKKDILNSIEVIREKVIKENKGYKNQIIFLEHDFEPYACFCGFGEGEYPILESPQYIQFNFREELFNGIGRVSYADFWAKRIEFDEEIEALDLSDLISDSDIYHHLNEAYQFKTNLLLYEAFEQIPIESFEGIPIKLPLFIFENQHDCEALNVYLYE